MALPGSAGKDQVWCHTTGWRGRVTWQKSQMSVDITPFTRAIHGVGQEKYKVCVGGRQGLSAAWAGVHPNPRHMSIFRWFTGPERTFALLQLIQIGWKLMLWEETFPRDYNMSALYHLTFPGKGPSQPSPHRDYNMTALYWLSLRISSVSGKSPANRVLTEQMHHTLQFHWLSS